MRDEEKRFALQYENRLKTWKENRTAPTVKGEDIALTLTKRTGIPVEEIGKNEGEKLARLKADLQREVLGQDEVIARVFSAVCRSRAGIRDGNRPIASFLFLGPSGVGKTSLARALASSLFGEKQALLRFDMSEYTEKYSASSLIGAPPGYVGCDEGGVLTEAVRRRPYAVVLFDEIEKAHPDVINLLLQILEDGKLTDSHGKTVSFCHALIVMTSNAGLPTGRPLGFLGEEKTKGKTRKDLKESLSPAFRPEFLNRIDEILPFAPLDRDICRNIIARLLQKTAKRLHSAGVEISFDESCLDFLLLRGFDASDGARPLRRAVVDLLENPLADKLLSNEIREGDGVRVFCRDGALVFSPVPASPPALSSPCALFASEEKREESAPLSPAEK